MKTTSSSVKAALALGGIALVAVGLLALTERTARDRISAARTAAEQRALQIVLPAGRYDNDPLADRIEVEAPRWLGGDRPLQVWRARLAGQPAALVFEAEASDGYAGAIRLRIGVEADGRISGVRVTGHRETPGLGDAIEAERSNWIRGFDGRALGDPAAQDWKVRRDGGAFDQFAGATITPRAVVGAVRRALQYAATHGDSLYAAPIGTRLAHVDGPAIDSPPTTPTASIRQP
jgi:electron transport complex protein RnfG